MATESVTGQMRRLIREGKTPAEVAEAAMADMPKRWRDVARPFVLRIARGIEGQVVNRRMRRVFTGAGGGVRHQEAAVVRLETTVYRTATGTRIVWSHWTVDELELKIAQLRKQVGSLLEHLRILESARDLCVEKGVDRIGEIPGWIDLVRERLAQKHVDDASGEVVAA
jgi:hypothetical protein